MAEVEQEKNRGLTFAEQQLVRHGWEQGKGLGRHENGISEAIKVKVKCDKGGVGHKESEQFTFHWWDHVFNKACTSLAVESGQDGVLLKKTEGADEGVISNKKPRKAKANKSVLYGRFVKSATLLSGQEQPECRSPCSEDSSSSEDEEKLNLSSTTKLSDAELIKACGGRTAHKGARHGLTMSAKLARLEQQEQEFMAKYGKKTARSPPRSEAVPPSTTPGTALDQQPKYKKAKREEEQDSAESPAQPPDTHRDEGASKKQKKCFRDTPSAPVESEETIHSKPKEKKRRKCLEQIAELGGGWNGCSGLVRDRSPQQNERAPAPKPHGGAAHLLEGECVPKKEKRKKKRVEQMAESEEVFKENGLEVSECYGQEQQQEGGVALHPAHDSVTKKKKKKKNKSCKPNKQEASAPEPDTIHSWDTGRTDSKTENVEMAVGGTKKCDHKKSKRCRLEEQRGGILDGPIDPPVEKKKKKKKQAK